jgi:hypothetical protein
VLAEELARSPACTRVADLHVFRAAAGMPFHGGSSGAQEPRHRCGRPSAGQDWKEEACKQAKGWGECPRGQEVGRAGRSSLSARSARPASCPHRCPQKPLMHNKSKRRKKKYTSKKVAKGRGHRRGHSPHRGRIALPRDRSGRRIPSRPSSATRKESAHALKQASR